MIFVDNNDSLVEYTIMDLTTCSWNWPRYGWLSHTSLKYMYISEFDACVSWLYVVCHWFPNISWVCAFVLKSLCIYVYANVSTCIYLYLCIVNAFLIYCIFFCLFKIPSLYNKIKIITVYFSKNSILQSLYVVVFTVIMSPAKSNYSNFIEDETRWSMKYHLHLLTSPPLLKTTSLIL